MAFESIEASYIGDQLKDNVGRMVNNMRDNANGYKRDASNLSIVSGLNSMSTVGSMFNSVAHGLAKNNRVRITSGPQIGQMRFVLTSAGFDSVLLDSPFSADQINQSWEKIVGLLLPEIAKNMVDDANEFLRRIKFVSDLAARNPTKFSAAVISNGWTVADLNNLRTVLVGSCNHTKVVQLTTTAQINTEADAILTTVPDFERSF